MPIGTRRGTTPGTGRLRRIRIGIAALKAPPGSM